MRLLVPALLLVALLAVPPAQAVVCGPVQPVGEFVDCLYVTVTEAGGALVDDVTDFIDCLLDPSCRP